MADILYILAGSHSEAACFAVDHNIVMSNARYVTGEVTLRGLINPSFVVLPGFWNRKDAWQIWRGLMMCCRGVQPAVPAPPPVAVPPPAPDPAPLIETELPGIKQPQKKHFKRIPEDDA